MFHSLNRLDIRINYHNLEIINQEATQKSICMVDQPRPYIYV